MLKKLLVLSLGLVSCGRVDSFLVEQWEGPEATGGRANETRNKVRQYFKEFRNSCIKNNNHRCLFNLGMIDEVRVVSHVKAGFEGENRRIEGRFTDYGNGVRTIQILDKDYKNETHLKHTLWHEMGHAIGKDHGDSNLMMRSHEPDTQIELYNALKDLTK